MKNFQIVGNNLDVIPLLLAIKQQPDLWKEDTYLRNYPQGPFGDVESIILRFPVRKVCASAEEMEEYMKGQDQHENYDMPVYATLPQARPLVMWLLARVQGERLGRVIINKLRPGGMITAHKDSKPHTDYYSRFHIPLQSGPGAIIRAGDETLHMPVGSAWWFNNAEQHEVMNNSADDRIHLIVDVRTPK